MRTFLILATITSLLGNLPQVTEPELMRVTCYTWTGNRTASGEYPYEGICASSRENLGKIALVYDTEMNLIGIYECKDTGGAESIKNGTSIDIYYDSLDDAKQFIKDHGDYQYVVFMDGKGD